MPPWEYLDGSARVADYLHRYRILQDGWRAPALGCPNEARATSIYL
jgi:hypothetical protein